MPPPSTPTATATPTTSMKMMMMMMMFGHKRTSLVLRRNPTHILPNLAKFSCLLHHQRFPKFVVASSLGSVFTSGNAIAAAAAASASASAHAAVTSAITHVAVTAVAIASGACLSTKVDFLWPKVDEQPGQTLTLLLSIFFFFGSFYLCVFSTGLNN